MSDGIKLQPETILHVTTEKESRLWSQGGITDDREESLGKEPADIGMCIIQHGTSTRNIHNYFMGLEQRKCCLLLAACKQTFFSVRLVRNDGRDSGIEEGAMMKSSIGNTETVTCLDAEEFQVFQHALKCAAFPVLGAPDPPSEATPIPSGTLSSGYTKRKETTGMLQYDRSMTPLSLNDSGVEEQEDTAMVPAETLCELLRRAFRLSHDKFNQYEEIIAAQLEKKSPQKILAEELLRQLIALENNQNPYYNPKTFQNRIGYDQWQQRERTNITDLLNKFWHFSLPQVSDRSVKMTSMHKRYRRLLEKLISYESPYRQQNEMIAPPPTSPLSSASVRLLKEFGLRYGVGEQYRKIVYLNYLSLNFDPTVWFIHHVMSSLTSVMESMPTKRSCLIIVKEEFSILENSLHLLEAKSSAALAKMKTLYTAKRPLDGVESLIELLSLTMKAKAYLLMSPEDQLGNRLFKIVQAIFPTTYERHKMVAQDELRHNKWDTELSPQLLNMLIGYMRDEVQDYKQNYQSAFSRYFNITVEAAQEFYKLLMADVAELLNQASDKNELEINKLMLSLAYRLNQLDQDWNIYISPQMQSWRELFLLKAQHWGVMLKLDMQKFVTHAVSRDRYPLCELQWTGTLSSSEGDARQRTISKSLTPSTNSAFTSPSSAFSTPSYMPGSTSQPYQTASQSHSKESKSHQPASFPVDTFLSSLPDSLDLYSERRPSSDPINISHSLVLTGSYLGDVARSLGHYDDENLLSFAHLRHSSSLPNIHACEKYIEMLPTSFNGSCHGNQKKRENHPSFHDFTKSYSPEIQKLMSTKVEKGQHEESDDSGTLTDDTCSEEETFSFPPLQEVRSSQPTGKTSEDTPVTMISDVAGSTAFVKPVTNDESTSGVPVKPVPRIQSNQPASAFSSLVRPVPQQKSGIEDSQKISVDKLKSIPAPLAMNKNQMVYSDLSSNKGSDYNVQRSPLKTQVSILRDSELHHVRASAIVPEDSLTNSLNSNISLPHPPQTQESVLTTLPISSSAVDIIIILQRLVGIGKVLCKTLAPTRPGYDSDMSPQTSGREDDLPLPPVYTKSRQKLYDCFLSAIRGTVTVYADNMLCMDLCGTTQSMASRLAGPRLIEYLRTQQKSGLIWGCRHDLTPNKNCFEYLNKQKALLCDRHEPINRQMCSRINNVSMMLTCLGWYHHCLGNAFGIYGDLSVKQNRKYLQTSFGSTDMLRSEFIVVDGYDYDPAYDRSEVMETASQLCPNQKSSPEGQLLVTSPVDTDRDHLMAVLRALCRVMAYRLNLFVCDALPVLLTLKSTETPIDTALKPVTDFLSSYIGTLHGWLYKDPYIRVLECLWIFIVQDFEIELGKIEKSDDNTQNRGQLLLQALAHLLKFMNNQHESLRRELLLSQADDVSFRLSLYAMPLTQLISIYRGLNRDIGSSSEVSSTDTQYQSILLIRQRLKHDLQTFRKGFSGSELICWILNNQHLFDSFELGLPENRVTRETANIIAQRFLDWNLIADVEGESVRGRSSPTGSVDEFQFPEMTIHAHTGLSESKDRPFSPDSSDSTPPATPRATPKPGLKASLRALSRQSGLKSSTPAIRQSDRSNVVSSARSQRMNESDRSLKTDQSRVVTVQSGQGATSSVITEKLTSIERERSVENEKVVKKQKSTDRVDSGFENVSVDSEEILTSLPSSSRWKYSNDFDPYLTRGTPLSIASTVSLDSRRAVFFESSDNFYYVCPYIGDEQDPTWANYELVHLVEECFQKKVTAEYVMRIIYSRRKYDSHARMFLKSSPVEVIEKIQFGAVQEDVPRCVSS